MVLRKRKQNETQRKFGAVIGIAHSPVAECRPSSISSQIGFCHRAIKRGGGKIFEQIEQPRNMVWLCDKRGVMTLHQAIFPRLQCVVIRGFIHEPTPMNHPVIMQVLFPCELSLTVYSAEWWDYYGGESPEIKTMEGTLHSIVESVRQKEHLRIAPRRVTQVNPSKSRGGTV